MIGAVNAGVIRVDGRTYPMPKHGFARHAAFTVVEQAADRAVLRLTDSAATLAAWPFAFVLEIAFRVADATLSVEARIANPGAAPMPVSFGFHPAFAWPLPYGEPRADHRLGFDQPEPAPLRALTADGLVAAATRPTPVMGGTLPLADALFTQDALIWDTLASQAVTYGASAGPRLRIGFPDTPLLGVWTKPGARYICIEPWHGIADPVGYDGDLRAKPGVFEIAAGGERRITLRVTLAR